MDSILKDKTKLDDKSFVIVCHDIVYGPPHSLRDYLLKNNADQVFFIGHPNMAVLNNQIKNSYAVLYHKGIERRSFKSNIEKLPEILSYIKDSFITFFWVLFKVRGKIDLFVGAGNLNAFVGLILKSFGKVRKVVYYVIDYIPDRFQNKWINTIYHLVEKWCAKYSSITWNYSGAMIREREKKWRHTFPHQIVTPHGIFVKKENYLSMNKVHSRELVYMGFIHKYQGIELAIGALEDLIKVFPDICLIIIGKGDEYEQEIRNEVKKKKLDKNVSFLGFMKDPHKMEQRVAQAVLGICTYKPDHPYVKNTDPGKVKTYLGCGVPVLMTDIAPIAKEIQDNKSGFVIPYNRSDFVKVVIDYLKNKSMIKEYRKNAFHLALKYDWDNIFTYALEMAINGK
jgi:glycosyltransferase involved in cell wall biosynthesis